MILEDGFFLFFLKTREFDFMHVSIQMVSRMEF